MTSKAQRDASAKYDKTHTKGVYLKLNKETDADILDYLESKDNVQGYIKALIRKDILDYEIDTLKVIDDIFTNGVNSKYIVKPNK